jgi:hypothetical protein
MAEIETDLGTPLEWGAVAHFNTEHPHVHVALRGCRNGRTAGSPQSGLHPSGHPLHRGRLLHAPAWVSYRVRRRRSATSGGPSAPLYFA